jgi:hypothetical protein
MRRGAILFAHNNGDTDYYRMAEYTANRINRFLGIPVSIITDKQTLESTTIKYSFDNTIIIDADRSNNRGKSTWINKGRYRVYDVTPYDETLVLDTDYMVNSTRLLETFDQPSDFVCYQNSKYLLDNQPNEMMNGQTLSIYWATVMRFSKTDRVRDIFKMIEMVQNNYEHYASLHKFLPYTYRNDYATTIAVRTVNGHIDNKKDAITGRLIHAGHDIWVERVDDTTYDISSDIEINGRSRRQYIRIKDFDFHMLSKTNFMRLIND